MTETLDRLLVALADRYTLERELGRGGMATVYLAQDLRHRLRQEPDIWLASNFGASP